MLTATQQLSAPVKPFIQTSSGMAGGISDAQRAPEPPTIGTQPQWDLAAQIAQSMLDNKGQNWDNNLPKSAQPDNYIQNQDALFYCSVRTPNNPPLGFSGRLPEQGTGQNGVITYFFNGDQYDQSVANWCQDNR